MVRRIQGHGPDSALIGGSWATRSAGSRSLCSKNRQTAPGILEPQPGDCGSRRLAAERVHCVRGDLRVADESGPTGV